MAYKLPKTFIYKGHTWSIILEKNLHHEDGDKCDGITYSEEKVIYLESTLPKKKVMYTLYHELFHVLVAEAHIPENAVMTIDIEEILSDAFAELIQSVFITRWRK